MTHPFVSAPAWVRDKGQEERQRRSEECRSVLGPQAILVVSPGVQGAGAHGLPS